jgi:predicted acyltransferase (DUF342 family)
MSGFKDFGINLKVVSVPLTANPNHLAINATSGNYLNITNDLGGFGNLHVQDLQVDGVANVNAGFWNIDYANIEYTLSVSGNVDFASDLLVQNDLSVWGQTYVGSDLEVVGNTKTDSNLSVGLNCNISGNSIIYGNSNVLNNLSVGASVGISGNQSVLGNSSIGGNSKINGNSLVIGNENISGSLTLSGYVSADGNISTKQNILANGNATLQGNINVSGNSVIVGNNLIIGNNSISGNQSIVGNVKIYKDLIECGNTGISGSLLVGKYLSVSEGISGNSLKTISNSYIGGNSQIIGNESISGNLYVNGNVIINGSVSQGFSNTNDTLLQNNLIVSKDATISGSLDVETNLVVDGDVNIHTDLIVDGNVTVNGALNFLSMGIIDNDFHVGNDLYSHHDLFVENKATVSGSSFLHGLVTVGLPFNDINADLMQVINGSMSASKDIFAGRDLLVNRDIFGDNNLTINNDAFIKRDLFVTRDISGANDLTINNDIVVNNDATIRGKVVIGLPINDINGDLMLTINGRISATDDIITNSSFVAENYDEINNIYYTSSINGGGVSITTSTSGESYLTVSDGTFANGFTVRYFNDGNNTTQATINNNPILQMTTVTPSGSNYPGHVGDFAISGNYLCVCVSDNYWKRTSLSTW